MLRTIPVLVGLTIAAIGAWDQLGRKYSAVEDPAQTEAVARLTRALAHTPHPHASGAAILVSNTPWDSLSEACLDALTARARSVAQVASGVPNLPSAQEDSCGAAESAAPGGHKAMRKLGTPVAAWASADVRQACARWMKPQRLNAEPDNRGGQRYWCG